MDFSTYLARINYTGLAYPDYATLRGFQLAHMLSVPFENLDIVPLHRPIQLTEQALWDKIVVHRRGGFCYELNGMFAWLLKQVGFEVTYLNGRVFNRQGKLGMDFDHLTLLVRAPDQSARWPHAGGMAQSRRRPSGRRHEAAWLADVGFGDSFIEPLSFEERGEQVQGLRAYRLEQTSDGHILWQRNYAGIWERQYFFDLQPRKFPEDYEAGCLYHQTSPQSSFTHGSVISRATADGRVSLEAERLIVTWNGQREEREINKEQYPELLKEHFGVVL